MNPPSAWINSPACRHGPPACVPSTTVTSAGGQVRGNDGGPYSRRGPVNPKTGGKARSDQPATFADRGAAERMAASWGDAGREPGVGLFLSTHEAPAGLIRAALDLDGMRDPETGKIERVAEQIIADEFDTYTEASPSGTGLRVLFHLREEHIDALK